MHNEKYIARYSNYWLYVQFKSRFLTLRISQSNPI